MSQLNTYASAGVDISAGQRAVELMTEAVRSTYDARVLAGIGAFGGLFDASQLKQMAEPVLVASTDGVGTKTKVASRMNRWDSVGQDLVNHCVNDILVQGAQPLFFLDYVASSKLDAQQIATIVTGVAQACRENGCALLGGETAEMPGVYEQGEIDLAGTIVGVVDRTRIVDGTRIRAGDAIYGLPVTGLHTNGFSLARRVLHDLDWHDGSQLLDNTSIGDALLAVHRSYLNPIRKLWAAGIDVKGMAHITGGGFVDNLPRITPDGVSANIHLGTWRVPPIFRLIQSTGHIADAEMYHVFNMGLGMLLVVSPDQCGTVEAVLQDDCHRVGEIVNGNRSVQLT